AARRKPGARDLHAEAATAAPVRRPGHQDGGALRGEGRPDRALAPDRLAGAFFDLLGFGLELVADAEARLDERVARGVAVDLLAQPPNEDVDGAVAVRLASPPNLLQQLVTGDDASAVEGERVEQLELGRCQACVPAVD